MRLNVIRKMQYDRYTIYVMQFFHIFQYIFSDNKGEIYQDHFTLKPSILNIIKHKLHLIPEPYTREEMEYGEGLALAGATRSIDALNGKKELKEKPNQNVTGIPKKDGDCMWQTVELENGKMAYKCLDHGNIVPIIDGVKPKHEIEGILSPLQFRK